MYCIYRVLFVCLIRLVQFGVIQCSMQNFRCYIQKAAVPLVFNQFQPKFWESVVIMGNTSYFVLWLSDKFKNIRHLMISYISYIDIHKAMLFSSGRRSSRMSQLLKLASCSFSMVPYKSCKSLANYLKSFLNFCLNNLHEVTFDFLILVTVKFYENLT